MKNNISWDLPTKTRWLAIMREHQTADRFIQGSWIEDKDDHGIFRGCFFGCAMQSEEDPLEKAIEDMNLPSWLVYLVEKIFENLPITQAELFPVQLLEAIPTDTDLSGVECKQHILRLNRLLNLPNLSDSVINVITAVKDCWNQRLNGVPESDILWGSESAALVGATATESEVIAALKASARRVSLSASWSATRVAEAWSASVIASAAEESVREASWQTERDVLIQLLTEA
jgi:hypothetical protein